VLAPVSERPSKRTGPGPAPPGSTMSRRIRGSRCSSSKASTTGTPRCSPKARLSPGNRSRRSLEHHRAAQPRRRPGLGHCLDTDQPASVVRFRRGRLAGRIRVTDGPGDRHRLSKRRPFGNWPTWTTRAFAHRHHCHSSRVDSRQYDRRCPRLLETSEQDRCLARLGPGVRRNALLAAAHPRSWVWLSFGLRARRAP
jgi:hypothetical protein